MQGLGKQTQSATSRLHEQMQSTRVGQRWERMLRLHAHEVEAVLVVHADVRQDVETALTLLADGGPIDTETARAVERVLDDLQRHASVPLHRDITQLRDEVVLGRGRTLQEVLTA